MILLLIHIIPGEVKEKVIEGLWFQKGMLQFCNLGVEVSRAAGG